MVKSPSLETSRQRSAAAGSAHHPLSNIRQESSTLLSTNLLLRSTAHPPCPEEQETLEFTVPTDRTMLSLTGRLSLRLGRWLMLRTEQGRRQSVTHEQMMLLRETQRSIRREALTLYTLDMQRYLR